MKKIRQINKFLNLKIILFSALAGPLLTILHEMVHIFFFEIGGIKAHLIRFSMAAPVYYPYDFAGLQNAIQFYNSNSSTVFVASIAAPIFTLIISLFSLLLYYVIKTDYAWSMTMNPLFFRLIGATLKIPSFLNGSITKSDEAIAAHFIGLPLQTFLWPSIILGYICIILLMLITNKEHRIRNTLSTVIGGTLGYYFVEQIFDTIFI